MSVIEVLKVLVFGIVEGFTEWLPISSTGHMILLDDLIHLNVTDEFREVFMVVIQLGAILAVVLLYFKKLNPFVSMRYLRERDMRGVWPVGNVFGVKRHTMILWVKVVIACLPAAIVGIPLDDWMEAHLRSSYVVAATLILYGILFIVGENRNYGQRPAVERTGQISYKLALYIGLFQVLSLVPGTSRSGATILGAMVLGCSRSAAAGFFQSVLGFVLVIGASLLKLVKFGFGFTASEVFILIFGMVVAFLVSVYSIKFLMSYIRRNDFKLFGYYRIVLGIVVLLYFGIKAVMGLMAEA